MYSPPPIQTHVGRHLDVEPGALAAGETSGRKVRGDVRLERGLVLAEARIAINAIQRHARVGNQLGREPRQIAGEPFEQADHRSADVLLVLRLSKPEPVPVVVALERAEECEGLR